MKSIQIQKVPSFFPSGIIHPQLLVLSSQILKRKKNEPVTAEAGNACIAQITHGRLFFRKYFPTKN